MNKITGTNFSVKNATVVTAKLGAGRLTQLDALRGVSALAVVFEHCLLVFPVFWAAYSLGYGPALSWYVDAISFTPLRIFWAGSTAVTIFFVLSGLVLSLPFWGGRQPIYSTYLFRRILRIYPIYILSLLLAYLLFSISAAPHPPDTSQWFAKFWNQQITMIEFVKALLFIPGNYGNLNGPLWTLIHEMRISLILPFCFSLMRKSALGVLLAATSLSLVAKFLVFYFKAEEGGGILITISFIWLFVAGAYIGMRLIDVQNFVANRNSAELAALGIAALLLISFKYTFPYFKVLGYLATALGAILIVACTAAHQTLLQSRMARELGAISYPLYALHFPILFAVLHMVGNYSLVLAIIIAVPFALCMAWLFERFFERPILLWSRQFSR